jgi:hypothetical protein
MMTSSPFSIYQCLKLLTLMMRFIQVEANREQRKAISRYQFFIFVYVIKEAYLFIYCILKKLEASKINNYADKCMDLGPVSWSIEFAVNLFICFVKLQAILTNIKLQVIIYVVI